ncbi:Fatty acid oxidation complex subunit alpha [Candidatus Rubidus massiliensis]|nr:MAG: fatty-acid oxidation protein subunit alpha [Chlamydia sp. 32-24]CDZ81771.1 Fatty acid oxidation complex subunit alpha [Candidatus Rubidus massiliensis]
MTNAFKLTVEPNNIARLIFDLPNEKVNKLTAEVLDELNQITDELRKRQDIKILLLMSAKEDIFIAGADLKEFEVKNNDFSRITNYLKKGHDIFDKWADLPFPTLAVIHGACMGGGTELALACTYRIVTDHPKTQISLPETSLGIVPGWGGMQRITRLIGLVEGIQMILTGRPVKAVKAWKLKLADAIAPWEFLDIKLDEFIDEILKPDGKRKILARRDQGSFKNWLMEKNPLGRYFVFKQSKDQVLSRTKGHYPAPIVALDILEKTYPLSLKEALKEELPMIEKEFPLLFENAQYLVQLFFMQEKLKKAPGLKEGAVILPLKSIGVIGAGTMGNGIAYVLSYNNFPVRLKDISWEAVGKGLSNISALYKKGIKDHKLNANEANLKFHKISPTIDNTGFKNCDFVIEAATENLDLKLQIYKEMEEALSEKAIIASNTSSISIDLMAQHLKHPERFIGLHFFNPVNKMPLVEVIPGAKTDPNVVATAVELCKKIHKIPLIVKNCPGFLVNRVFVPAANESLFLLQEGIDKQRIERLLLNFGLPMSPFHLADEVGNDVTYKVGKELHEAYGDRCVIPKILELLNQDKLYGKKVGKGFYIYNGKESRPNPEVDTLLEKARTPGDPLSDQDIIDRVIFLMVNEASQCLDEGVVNSPSDLDMGLIMGTGFPPFRGGLLHYADKRGIGEVVRQLRKFEKYGSRYKPSEYLLRLEREGRGFYSTPNLPVKKEVDLPVELKS